MKKINTTIKTCSDCPHCIKYAMPFGDDAPFCYNAEKYLTPDGSDDVAKGFDYDSDIAPFCPLQDAFDHNELTVSEVDPDDFEINIKDIGYIHVTRGNLDDKVTLVRVYSERKQIDCEDAIINIHSNLMIYDEDLIYD